jgi:catechol 2,3-dioxygenase-like lactoylglutathione lyase family enzyme
LSSPVSVTISRHHFSSPVIPIAIDTDELDALVKTMEGQGIRILEQTTVSGGRRVCFFEGPDGVQLEFIEMKAG